MGSLIDEPLPLPDDDRWPKMSKDKGFRGKASFCRLVMSFIEQHPQYCGKTPLEQLPDVEKVGPYRREDVNRGIVMYKAYGRTKTREKGKENVKMTSRPQGSKTADVPIRFITDDEIKNVGVPSKVKLTRVDFSINLRSAA